VVELDGHCASVVSTVCGNFAGCVLLEHITAGQCHHVEAKRYEQKQGYEGSFHFGFPPMKKYFYLLKA
jgi:hypothetical protein